MRIDIALSAHPLRRQTAEQYASRFNLPLGGDLSKTTYELRLDGERLELHDRRANAPGPVYVDFTTGGSRHRQMFGGGRKQPLARAVGIKSGYTPSILDCTAGLGRDAFVLATLGCRVTLIERSPALAALLYDGLERASLDVNTAEIVARMQLVHSDAVAYLRKLTTGQQPDTIYLDPMYPHRTKSALVKKEMRIARELVGDDEDAPALLEAARERGVKRVVVKRPANAPALADPEPDAVIRSRKTRYDIYIKPDTRGKGQDTS